MRKQITAVSLAILLAFALSGCATCREHHAVEYKVVRAFAYPSLEKQLNDLSQQGWSVISISTSQQSVGKDGVPEVIVLLKRAKH